METSIQYKHGDILKASPGCLIVLEHGGKLYAHWFYTVDKTFTGTMDVEFLSFKVEKIGEFTADMAKALEELFLEYYEENKNV